MTPLLSASVFWKIVFRIEMFASNIDTHGSPIYVILRASASGSGFSCKTTFVACTLKGSYFIVIFSNLVPVNFFAVTFLTSTVNRSRSPQAQPERMRERGQGARSSEICGISSMRVSTCSSHTEPTGQPTPRRV